MPLDLDLDAVDQRVLGALLEKQRTVPATYPMTLNALRSACNQTSSRDPVTDYDEPMLQERLKDLKERGLVRIVWADRGPRTLKYHQLLDEKLPLDEAERALLTVLLLRGPQAPGELRTRTERLHAFADRGEVEQVLRRMAAGAAPLVHELPRRPGQHDARWVHLLGPVEDDHAAGPAPTGVDREGVLAEGSAARDAKVRATYDAVATAYADRLAAELDRKPFDRWLLERLAALAEGRPVVDVGTGPGHVAAYLAAAGADASGVDLSPGMVEEARRRFPDLRFSVGDLTGLLRPPAASGWGAITAWYALVHLAGSEVAPAIGSLARVLAPGGWLALALHAGAEVHHADELMGEPVDVDFVLHDPEAVVAAMRAAGLVDVEWYLRGPLDGEVETDRVYVLGRHP
ncbi:DUF480 domain-containing protein [Nocardioides islandensis]|uniref:DUF480 domain-containing protein n=1 Tax=Nocardioides islandensis TaxID=433663 RepID=UPI002B26885A|nr:DUF480 domain-containing protein [Nocardioides islandensis]